jgi:hypothetical protein
LTSHKFPRPCVDVRDADDSSSGASTTPPDSSHRIDAPERPIDSVRRRLFGGAVAAGVLGILPVDGFARGEPGAPMNVRFTHGVASGGHFNVYAEAVKRLEKDPGCYATTMALTRR